MRFPGKMTGHDVFQFLCFKDFAFIIFLVDRLSIQHWYWAHRMESEVEREAYHL